MKNIFTQNKFAKPKHLQQTGLKLKTKTNVKIGFVGIVSILAGVQASNYVANQVSADSSNTTFEVNVTESLTVTIDAPTEGDSGNYNTFLRDRVGVSVTSNNSAGFTASMFADNQETGATAATDLLSSDKTNTIATMSSSATRASFPADSWGYSLGEYKLNDVTQSSYTLDGKSYGETLAGNTSSNYYPLTSNSASPITLISAGSGVTSGSQEIYFGAKTSISKASGTYAGVVKISVVSGVIDSNTNPITPTNPATPEDDVVYNDNTPTPTTNSRGVGSSRSASGTTITSTNVTTHGSASDGTTTTETQVASPLGVNRRTAPASSDGTTYEVDQGNPLVTGLAVTAGVAATSGLVLFALAKRKKDDDEEEQDQF